jgi:signal transduction histidine kinase
MGHKLHNSTMFKILQPHRYIQLLIVSVSFGFISNIALSEPAPLMVAIVEAGSVGEEIIDELPTPTGFRRYSNGFNLGFEEQEVWIAVSSSIVSEDHYLTIQPVHLDNIQVYTASRQLLFEGGDTVRSPRSLMAGGYTIPIDDEIEGEALYIRLSSRNIMQPFVSIETAETLFRRSLGVLLTGTVALSISLFYLAWAASVVLTSNNVLTIAFILRLLAFVVTSGIHSGIFRQLAGGEMLPPQDLAHNLSALGYITIAQAFDYFLLRETAHNRIAQAFGLVVVISALAKFGLFASGDVSAALQTNNITALLTLVLGLVLSPLPNGRKQRVMNTETASLSRLVPTFYFMLQAIPLAALFALTALGSSQYLEYADMVFFNYAIVPGGFMVYVLARRQRQQAKLKKDLQEKADRLQRERQAESEKRRDIGNLLNMLTHEIKTPLATLQMAQAVGQVDEDILAKATRAISQAVTQADRVEEIEQGQPLVEAVNVDICAAVKTAATNSYGDLSVDCGDQPISVSTDPGLLQIILSNLITNAQKYSRPGMTPNVKVRSTNKGVSVAMTNGLDRPLQASDRLTEKYYRDPTNQGESGTGLGLYIVPDVTFTGFLVEEFALTRASNRLMAATKISGSTGLVR